MPPSLSPPNFVILCFLYVNLLSTLCAAKLCTGVEPYSLAWIDFPGQISEENLIFLSLLPSINNDISASGESL